MKVFMIMTAIALAAVAGAEKPMLIFNEDNSHFYGTGKAEDMTLEGLNAFIDQYADTAMTHFFLCPNCMRPSFASEVWDPIWKTDGRDMSLYGPDSFVLPWMENARLLHERGLDPYAVWIARCREKGISPWLSMRMNDVHDVNQLKSLLHSDLWVAHPEYWRVPGGNGWTDRAFDYTIPEVREHHMKFIRELLTRYDMDGIELDWMRFGWHFPPGKEEEGRLIFNDFTREVRGLCRKAGKRLGHPVQLSARVPAHPDAAAGLGMDGVTWVKEGLVDVLVPTPFWATADFDIPFELWRERMGKKADKIVLAAGQEILLRAYPGAGHVLNDLASLRGFAAASLHRGADCIYLFNHFTPAPFQGGDEKMYRELLEKGLSLEAACAAPRRHVVTYRDTVPPGMSNNAQLPRDTGKAVEFRLYTGPAPEAGKVVVITGLADQEGVKDAAFSAALNGAACTASADAEDISGFPGAVRAVRFDCPLDAMREGYNTVQLTQPDGPAQKIIWFEIRIEPGK